MIPAAIRRFSLPLLVCAAALTPGLGIAPGSLSAQNSGAPGDAQQILEISKLVILSGARSHEFTVELADDSDERRRGLMFRKSMAPDHGMLFRHDRPTRAAMWMKDTYIPLDILFIQQDGVIVNIATDAKPRTLTQIASKGRVLGVLELNAGTTQRLGIRPGDQVLHAIFHNAPAGG